MYMLNRWSHLCIYIRGAADVSYICIVGTTCIYEYMIGEATFACMIVGATYMAMCILEVQTVGGATRICKIGGATFVHIQQGEPPVLCKIGGATYVHV